MDPQKKMHAENAWEKGADLEVIFREAIEAPPALDKRIEKGEWTLNAVAYGAVAILGIITHPLAGLLAGIGYRLAERKVTNMVAPKLAKIRYNPLSVAIWQFQRKFEDIKELKKMLRKLDR